MLFEAVIDGTVTSNGLPRTKANPTAVDRRTYYLDLGRQHARINKLHYDNGVVTAAYSEGSASGNKPSPLRYGTYQWATEVGMARDVHLSPLSFSAMMQYKKDFWASLEVSVHWTRWASRATAFDSLNGTIVFWEAQRQQKGLANMAAWSADRRRSGLVNSSCRTTRLSGAKRDSFNRSSKRLTGRINKATTKRADDLGRRRRLWWYENHASDDRLASSFSTRKSALSLWKS